MIDRIVHGEVFELRLNRPPVNALSPDLLRVLSEEIREAPGRGARALVLSGREGMFSAGLDVPVLMALGRDELREGLETFFDAMECLASSAIPVAAAITGHSPAGGAVLALFCDRRVMAQGEYSIGLNEVRIGIAMPQIIADALARTIGARSSEKLCVSGRLLKPAEALEIGLVDQVAPPDRVVEEALQWCGSILELPPRAMAETRFRVRQDLVALFQGQREEDSRRFAEEWFQPDLQAALKKLMASLKGK